VKIIVSILVVITLFLCVLISTRYNRPRQPSKSLKQEQVKKTIKIGDEQKNRKQKEKVLKEKKQHSESAIINSLFFSLV